MIIYLKIDKIAEDNNSVTYKFIDALNDNSEEGILFVSKLNGDVKIIKNLPNDKENKLAGYAYIQIMNHLQKGEFPDKTCYAA